LPKRPEHSFYAKLKKKIMVRQAVSNSACDYNDPVRKRLIEAKREHAARQNKDYSHVFSKKSRLDIIRLSFIMMGIEFAYAAETAFVSPILLKIGIDHSKMTMVWSLSPVFGFFISPILGSISDKCRLPCGRRRPLITLLSLGIITGLILVPFGNEIGALFGDYGDAMNITHSNDVNSMSEIVMNHNPASEAQSQDDLVFESYKYAVLFTVLGTILLDFNADNCLTPARAYLLDVTLPEDHTKALSTSTLMAGTGAGLGYLLGGVNWEQLYIGKLLGGNIKTVFIIVLFLFAIGSVITLTSFPEIPLPLLEQDEMLRPVTNKAVKKEKSRNFPDYSTINGKTEIVLNAKDLNGNGLVNGYQDLEAGSSSDEEDENVTFFQYLKSIVIMPPALRILCLTNYFAWMAHSCYCLYFTDFVGEAVFLGDPKASPDSAAYHLYNDGVRFGCYGMAIYSIACCLYSTTIEKLNKYLGGRVVYVGGILIFCIGMLFMGLYPTKELVLILSTTGGVIYATQFTFPFILVARYHSKGCFRMQKGQEILSTENRGLATDIAIVGSMLFVAQFTVSLSIGTFIEWIGSTTAVMFAASIFAALASISALKVQYMGL